MAGLTAAAQHQSEGSGAGTLLLLLIVAAIVGYFLWRLSLRTHPYRRCPRCKGAGRMYNPVLGNSFRNCPRCKGSAKLVRFGAHPGSD